MQLLPLRMALTKALMVHFAGGGPVFHRCLIAKTFKKPVEIGSIFKTQLESDFFYRFENGKEAALTRALNGHEYVRWLFSRFAL